MKRLCLWITSLAVAVLAGTTGDVPAAYGFGTTLILQNENISRCSVDSIDVNFSKWPLLSYPSRGQCDVIYDDNDSKSSTFDKEKRIGKVQWTADATYNAARNGETVETITVRQEYYDRPGYITTGTLYSRMYCPKDPWREPANLSCNSPSVQSTGVLEYENREALYPIFQRLPPTSLIKPEQRAALNKKYQLSRPVQEAVGPTASQGFDSYMVSPSVLAPTKGLVVYERTPMPIKLAPPKGWSATNYIVTIQAKDSKGNWFTNSTFPVGAVQAHSAVGYTGFGAGAPPAFLSIPGAWRLKAQVSSPKQSGPSDWVEFSVMRHNRIQR
jgi:hypothetical protein